MSTLSAFPFIGEQSFGTPGAFNSPLSIISANIAAINADVAAVSGVTITPPSGNTIQMPSDLSISGYLSVGKGVSIGTQAASIAEPVALTIGVNSGISDYLYFNDTSNLRSDYLIGSHAGGTADGLNIYDVSGSTLIATFSKQSVRFYSPIVGSITDTGGFVYNVKSYGARGDGVTDDTGAFITAESLASLAGGGSVVVPPGTYAVSSTITVHNLVSIFGAGSNSILSATTSFGRMVWIYSADVAGNRYGIIEGISLQGNSLASVGLFTEGVQRTCRQVNINGCREAGLVLNTAQNCLFEQVSVENNGIGNTATACGIRFNNGAASNVFLNCEVSLNTRTGILSIESSGLDPTNLLTGTPTPDNNTFYGCIIERLTSSSATLITLFNGRTNRFLDCTIATSIATGYAISLSSQGGRPASLNHFAKCFITGGSTATAVRAENGAFRNRFAGNLFEGWGGVYEADTTNSAIWLDAHNQYSLNASTVTFTSGSDQDTQYVGDVQEAQNAFRRRSLLTDGSSGRPALSFIQDTPIGLYRSAASTIGVVGALAVATGSATTPTLTFSSESSLGWYRSGASAMGLSYGQLQVPAGTAIQPSYAISSESSLGFYRSGASILALSYGTLNLPANQRFVFGSWNLVPGATTFKILNDNGAAAQLDTSNLLTLWQLTVNSTASFADAVILASGTAITPMLRFNSDQSLGFYRSGVSTLAMSFGTFNLATNAVRLSMRTIAASALTASAANTNVAVNEVVFTVQASGASFAINSGGTTWIFNSDASAKNT